MVDEAQKKLTEEQNKRVQASIKTFFADLLSAVKEQGSLGRYDDNRQTAHVDGIGFGYGLKITPIKVRGWRGFSGELSGAFQVTLESPERGRYANNKTWRSKSDGSIDVAPIATALIQYAKRRKEIDQAETERKAAHEVLTEAPAWKALKERVDATPRLTIQDRHDGTLTLTLWNLSLDDACRVALLLDQHGVVKKQP